MFRIEILPAVIMGMILFGVPYIILLSVYNKGEKEIDDYYKDGQ